MLRKVTTVVLSVFAAIAFTVGASMPASAHMRHHHHHHHHMMCGPFRMICLPMMGR
jgi:hypothetical protein